MQELTGRREAIDTANAKAAATGRTFVVVLVQDRTRTGHAVMDRRHADLAAVVYTARAGR